jgi:isopentenyl-diphosphate delta-isomerase
LVERGAIEYCAEVGGGLSENERVHIFRGDADRRVLEIAPNPDEVVETRWISLAALRAEMADKPEAFTPWFRVYLKRYPDLSL